MRLDLYQTNIPHIDADVFSGWGILQSGGAFEHLSPESQAKVARLGELVDQFVAADKIVIVNPEYHPYYGKGIAFSADDLALRHSFVNDRNVKKADQLADITRYSQLAPIL